MWEDGCTKLNRTVSRKRTNEKKKVPQGIKPLIPHRRSPHNLNASRLLHGFFCCHSMGYSDEVLPLHAESLDMGNVIRSED